MKLSIKIFDFDGKELEIENKALSDIVFESEETIEFFIHCIKTSLPLNFQYKLIPEKEYNLVTHRGRNIDKYTLLKSFPIPR